MFSSYNSGFLFDNVLGVLTEWRYKRYKWYKIMAAKRVLVEVVPGVPDVP